MSAARVLVSIVLRRAAVEFFCTRELEVDGERES